MQPDEDVHAGGVSFGSDGGCIEEDVLGFLELEIDLAERDKSHCVQQGVCICDYDYDFFSSCYVLLSMIPTATMIKDDPLGVDASPGNFVPLMRRDGDEMVCSFLMKFKECLQNQEDMTLLMKAKSNVRFLIHYESDEGKTLAAAFHRRDVEDAEAERLGHSPLKMAREYYSIHSWLVSCGLGGNAKDISDFLTTHNATDNPEKSNADVIKRHLLFFKRFYNCSVPGEACDPLDGCTFRSSLTRYPEYCKTRSLITSESCLITSESAIAI